MSAQRRGVGDPRTDPDSGAVLVRVFAHGRSWPRILPPAPADALVTVTVSDEGLLDVDAGDLRRAGYQIEGVVPALRAPGSGEVVDIYVTSGLRASYPGWWSELAASAMQIFDLRFGPVRHLLGPTLKAHGAEPG